MALLKGVDSPPGRQAVHLVADYVELMCAASIDGEYSAADFRAIRKIQDDDDSVPVEISDRELLLESDPSTLDPLMRESLALEDEASIPTSDEEVAAEPPDDGEAGANESPGPAAQDDARVLEASEVVQHLSFRAEAFDDAYPFELRDDDNLALKELSDARCTYLFLLLASSLPRLKEKSDEATITKAFELFCSHAVKAHFGTRFEVHVFGTSSRDGVDRYTGALWERLVKLGEDLRVAVIPTREEVQTNLSGDHGLDIVAWAPPGDEAPGLVVFFAQCACGRRWMTKQHEASDMHWRGVLSFTAPLAYGTLIPYCYRKIDGSWYVNYQLEHGVLMDRLRLLLALRRSPEDAERAAGEIASALVEKLLEEQLG